MKYDPHTSLIKTPNKQNENPLILVGQILTIIFACIWCFTLIGMIWGIPMIIGSLQRIQGKRTVTLTHCIIAIIFYWIIGGVLTLVGALQEKLI